MNNSTNIKDTLTILIDYIKEQLVTETLDLLPSPAPSSREEKNAYEELSIVENDYTIDSPTPSSREEKNTCEELSMAENDYTIIKSAWPIHNYIPYIIYMVRYDGRYWVVSLPHKDSTTKYRINEYFPPQEK